MGTRGGRLLLVLLALALVGVAVGAFLALRPDRDPVPAALAVLDDDDRFSTAVEASDAFAEVSGRLNEVDCDADRDEDCARVPRAEAWAQVAAVRIVRCPPSAVFEARAELARYLRRGGPLPAVPRCERRQAASS
jgi:hypothetical protein